VTTATSRLARLDCCAVSAQALRAGIPITEVVGVNYEHMLKE